MTNKCSLVLKEAIVYYVNRGSTIYCTTLDTSKAFDRVEYCKLFRSLASRDLPSAWLRLLMNIYINSSTRIAWSGMCSAMFLVDIGVKQGGVMSPILLCIYLDGLLNLMDAAQIGCFRGRVFVGSHPYADDIVLLTSTPGAMCTQYACNL